MQGYNAILVYDFSDEQILFCHRVKEPYKGKYNLVVNANVSSAIGDYGYATVLKTTLIILYIFSIEYIIYKWYT